MTVIAVKKVCARVHARVTAENSVPPTDREAVIAERTTGCRTREVTVKRIRETLHCCRVPAVLAILEVITLENISAVIEVITNHILTIETVVVLHDFLPDKFGNTLLRKLNGLPMACIEFCKFPSILFSRMRLIEDVVFLIF